MGRIPMVLNLAVLTWIRRRPYWGGDPTFESEVVDAYELGLKSVMFGGRVRANAALFFTDLTDFQVLEFSCLAIFRSKMPS